MIVVGIATLLAFAAAIAMLYKQHQDARLAESIAQLSARLQKMGVGSLDLEPLAISPEDPLAELSASVNKAGEDLYRYIATLEGLIHDRTNDLRRQSRQLQLIIENTRAVPFVFDVETKIFLYVGDNVREIFSVDDDTALIDAFSWPSANVLFEPNNLRPETDVLINGIEARVTAGREIDGVHLLRGLIFDVSQQRTLERELAEAQRLEAVGRLAAGVAHEINTPMQYIGDNVGFLKKAFERVDDVIRAATETEAEEVVAVMEQRRVPRVMSRVPNAIEQTLEGIESVSKIVAAMKAFTHPGDGEPEPTDIEALLKTTATVCRSEWKYVAVVEFEIEAPLPLVPCHAPELRQCVLNMIVNAAQAMKDNPELGRITLRAAATDEHLKLVVADDGGGMPPEVAARAFDPFFTTKPVGIGTGQGLAISRDIIVNKHHGRLQLDNEPGVGATFTIQIPLQQPREAA